MDKGMNRVDQLSDLKEIHLVGMGEERGGKSQHQIIKQLLRTQQIKDTL